MTLASSERDTADGTQISQMGDKVVATKEDFSLPRNFDLTEFAYQNREVVSFENASVNIDNSNDVILGPVTQFSVNGNVTIVQNGNREDVDVEGTEKKNSISSYGAAKLQKTEKSSSEEQDAKFLIQNKKIMKTLVAIITSLFFVIAIITVIVIETNSNTNDEFYDIPPTAETENLNRHQVLLKSHWNGREPRSVRNITPPVDMVIIKHTGGSTCKSFEKCAGIVQTIQSMNMGKNFTDIYCNFLIGGDGNIYVGRGWDVQNAQRDHTIDIVFIGSFSIDVPTPSMFDAALLLIEDGVRKKKLDPKYKVVCHNQTISQESPGVNVFKEVVKWPHYDHGLYFPEHLGG